MTKAEVLIFEMFTIDAFATFSVEFSDIATLYNEIFDNSMEYGTFVMQRLSTLAFSFLTCAQCSKVLRCFGYYMSKQFNHNSSTLLTYLDIHPNLWIVGIREGFLQLRDYVNFLFFVHISLFEDFTESVLLSTVRLFRSIIDIFYQISKLPVLWFCKYSCFYVRFCFIKLTEFCVA